MSAIRDELIALIKQGKSLDEIMQAGVTKRWEKKMGDPAQFINRSYTSLTTKYLP